MEKCKYILACDEHGSIFRFTNSKSWIYGGIIFKDRDKHTLTYQWNEIKERLCGNSKIELKWKHFFVQEKDNPLLSQENIDEQLSWALNAIFKFNYIITPVSIRVPKDRASDLCYRTSARENQVLDCEVLSVALYGQFATFLKKVEGNGEIWFDQLGSLKEQARRQTDWETLRDTDEVLNIILRRIESRIKFFDSKTEPIIQIADFVSGVIWAAAEGEEKYLLEYFQSYFPKWWGRINLITIT